MYNNEELNEMVHRLRELNREAEEINSLIESIKNDLKSEMTERGEYELVGDDWKITWNLVSSRRFNQSLFKSSHPDLFEHYLALSESRRFILG